jgi:hypothetical protein
MMLRKPPVETDPFVGKLLNWCERQVRTEQGEEDFAYRGQITAVLAGGTILAVEESPGCHRLVALTNSNIHSVLLFDSQEALERYVYLPGDPP